MSTLEWQCRELRRLADKLGNEEEVSVPFVRVLVIPIMREAADTIERLQDRLQESYGQVPEQGKDENESERESYAKQECNATQANYEHCKYSTDRGWRDTSRYSELFGTPERAAQTLKDGTPLCSWCDKQTCAETRGGECSLFYYDALLEWLNQGVDA